MNGKNTLVILQFYVKKFTTMRKISLFSIILLASIQAFSQQNAHYSQYVFNLLVINPAYAGAKGLVNINAMYNAQWYGLEGAPKTLTLSAEGPIFNTMGVGIHFMQDELGAQKQTSVYGSYAYKLRLSQNWRLSLGLSAGISYFNLDGNKFTVNDENLIDPSIPKTNVTTSLFDSKFGVFLFSKRFYAGFSISDLTANIKSPNDLLTTSQRQHFYLTSGYVIKLNETFKLKPSFMIKEDLKSLTNIDLSSYVLYKNTIWFGVTYRTGAKIITSNQLDQSLKFKDAIIFMLDYNATDNLRIGYSYQYSLNKLNNFYGHEILVGYYFAKTPKTKMLTPRYF